MLQNPTDTKRQQIQIVHDNEREKKATTSAKNIRGFLFEKDLVITAYVAQEKSRVAIRTIYHPIYNSKGFLASQYTHG